jgi:ubiquinone/menaquinone biosynthesis C-methylase UbiE
MKSPVVQEYARLAPKYDTQWSFYTEATTRETLARLSLRPADRLLDVGCGSAMVVLSDREGPKSTGRS